MKLLNFYSFAFSILCFTACSGEKASIVKLPTINIDGSTEHFDDDYTLGACGALFKNPKFLQPETKEECLLGGSAAVLDVTSKYLVVADKEKTYFFDVHSGAFISKVDRQGDGPEEYPQVFFRHFDEEKELLWISTPTKIKSYKPDGTYVKEYANDKFTNLVATTDGYWGLYKREYWKQHLLAFLDKDWQVKQSFLPDREAEFVNGEFYVPPRLREADNSICTLVYDTLYVTKEDKLLPSLIINKGKLKMPTEIIGDFERLASVGSSYIQADAALAVGDLLFYNFFWDRSRHFTIWNLKTGELLTHSKNGYSVPIDEKITINTTFSLIKNNKVYTLLSVDKLAESGLADDEDDFNPWLLSLDFAE